MQLPVCNPNHLLHNRPRHWCSADRKFCNLASSSGSISLGEHKHINKWKKGELQGISIVGSAQTIVPAGDISVSPPPVSPQSSWSSWHPGWRDQPTWQETLHTQCTISEAQDPHSCLIGELEKPGSDGDQMGVVGRGGDGDGHGAPKLRILSEESMVCCCCWISLEVA